MKAPWSEERCSDMRRLCACRPRSSSCRIMRPTAGGNAVNRPNGRAIEGPGRRAPPTTPSRANDQVTTRLHDGTKAVAQRGADGSIRRNWKTSPETDQPVQRRERRLMYLDPSISQAMADPSVHTTLDWSIARSSPARDRVVSGAGWVAGRTDAACQRQGRTRTLHGRGRDPVGEWFVRATVRVRQTGESSGPTAGATSSRRD